jgi:acetyl esterase/lipase
MRIIPELTIRAVLFAILRIILLAYIGLGVVLYIRQDNMLFFPDQTPFAQCSDFSHAEIVDMEGTRGYFIPHGTSTDVLVFYHGNGGRACDRSPYETVALNSGYSILLVEYTGYAGDGQSPSTAHVLRDVERANRWVNNRHPKHIAIVGESIGTGAASYHSSLANPEKLALVAPFDRLSSAAFDVYPVYPIRLLLHVDLDNEKWAKSAGSVLIIHGTKDPVIRFARGKALFDSLPQVNKQFIELPGATHEDALSSDKTLFAITQFLKGDKVVGDREAQ